jgi:hypothetical protein
MQFLLPRLSQALSLLESQYGRLNRKRVQGPPKAFTSSAAKLDVFGVDAALLHELALSSFVLLPYMVALAWSPQRSMTAEWPDFGAMSSMPPCTYHA